MKQQYDVIVVGVGSMGAAACYHLARRGAKVLGLEQFSVAHDRGAHHGQSRVIRLAYYPFAEYIPLLRRAYELWEELENETEECLFQITGGAFMGPAESQLIRRAIDVSLEQETAYELWDEAQLRQQFSQFRLPEGFQVFFDPQAGFLRPEQAVAAHAEFAERHGAVIRSQEPVAEWRVRAGGVVVQTAKESYQAAHVVLAGGGWSHRLLAELDLPLTVTRQVVAWFRPKVSRNFTAQKFPVWYVETEPAAGYYGFPKMPGQESVKIALDKPGKITTAESIDREVAQDEVDDLHEFLGRHVPDAAGELHSACVCQYTNTPDRHFIIDRHPAHDRVTMACGFSGHGFKFSSAVGEVLADLAIDGSTKIPLDFFRLSRPRLSQLKA